MLHARRARLSQYLGNIKGDFSSYFRRRQKRKEYRNFLKDSFNLIITFLTINNITIYEFIFPRMSL